MDVFFKFYNKDKKQKKPTKRQTQNKKDIGRQRERTDEKWMRNSQEKKGTEDDKSKFMAEGFTLAFSVITAKSAPSC